MKKHLHKPKPEMQIFHYTVALVNEKYVAKYVRSIPKASIPENTSVLWLPSGEEVGGITGDTKYGFHITWIDGKPESNTEKRGLGLMAVFNDSFLRLPLKVRKKLKKAALALAHLTPEALEKLK